MIGQRGISPRLARWHFSIFMTIFFRSAGVQSCTHWISTSLSTKIIIIIIIKFSASQCNKHVTHACLSSSLYIIRMIHERMYWHSYSDNSLIVLLIIFLSFHFFFFFFFISTPLGIDNFFLSSYSTYVRSLFLLLDG